MVTFSVNIDFLLAWYKIVLSTLALFGLQKINIIVNILQIFDKANYNTFQIYFDPSKAFLCKLIFVTAKNSKHFSHLLE